MPPRKTPASLVTHTNRKGQLYYLSELTTKKGNPRYVFSREPVGKPVATIPDGYEITESINGVVSLRKACASPILEPEIAALRAALAAHRHLGAYRVEARKQSLLVHEPISGMTSELADLITRYGGDPTTMRMNVRYSPVLRFTLAEPNKRTFTVERMCYLGGGDFWHFLGGPGKLDALARRFVPHLGKDSFFELM